MNAFIVISAAVILTLDLITPLSAGTLEDAATARERGDYSTALRLFRLLAEKGDPRAQSNLGVMYAKGEGVPQNYAEAANGIALLPSKATPALSLFSGSCTSRVMGYRRTM